MSLDRELIKRSGNQCELCAANENLKTYQIEPQILGGLNESIWACNTCITQIESDGDEDLNHWRCLNDSMWNEHKPVQIVAYRMLHKLKSAGWPQELIEQMYLDDETLKWAKTTIKDTDNQLVHKDANGVTLTHGDSVVLIKDLKVKGSSMVAKQGTAVRNIRLDYENAEYIEGKVDGQQIVIITKYVKKT